MSDRSRRNVLVSCGGKWVGIVLQLRNAMQSLPEFRHAKIIVASSDEFTAAGAFADISVRVPMIRDGDYIDRLLDICIEHSVGLVIPLIDLDLDRLAPHVQRFAAAEIIVSCPSPEMVALCFDKLAFYKFALAEGLAHPATHTADHISGMTFPGYYKTRRGFGSIGAGLCASFEQAIALCSEDPDLLFQALISAREVTVDAYIARNGMCIVRVPRLRDKVIAGEVFKSHTVRLPAVEELADRTISRLAALGLRGPLNVQIFLTDEPSLIEVNTRLGSGVVLSNIATGGRILRSMLIESGGQTATGDLNDFRAGLQLSRFWGDVVHAGSDVVSVFPR